MEIKYNQSASPQILSDLSSVFCKKVGDFFEIGVRKPYKIRAEDSEKLSVQRGGKAPLLFLQPERLQ